jgi:hypothetical protein
MTLMELAIAGFLAALVGAVALEALAARRGDGRVALAGWGGLIALAALGYQLRLMRLPTGREATILAWICIWAGAFGRDAWRLSPRALPVPARGTTGRIFRVTIEAFCGSLPFLLVLADEADDGWTWPETTALVLAALGLALLASARRAPGASSRNLIIGYVLSFAAVYALAFDAAAGALALYSVYVVARQCKRVFGASAAAAGPKAAEGAPTQPSASDLARAHGPGEPS